MAPRRVGCEAPLHPLQVLACTLLAALQAALGLVALPLLSNVAALALGIADAALLVAVAALALVIMLGDPRDPGVDRGSPALPAAPRLSAPGVALARGVTARLAAAAATERETQSDAVWCSICRISVRADSKHCRACDKCVLRFDHHCKWLNTCIGAANYGVFFSLLVACTAMLALQCGVFAAAAAFAFTDEQLLRARLAERGLPLSLAAALGVSLACAALSLLLLSMTAQLLALHVLLLCRGMTTYDYLLAKRGELPFAAARRSLARQLRSPPPQQQQLDAPRASFQAPPLPTASVAQQRASHVSVELASRPSQAQSAAAPLPEHALALAEAGQLPGIVTTDADATSPSPPPSPRAVARYGMERAAETQ
jgi:hypothetical protein